VRTSHDSDRAGEGAAVAKSWATEDERKDRRRGGARWSTRHRIRHPTTPNRSAEAYTARRAIVRHQAPAPMPIQVVMPRSRPRWRRETSPNGLKREGEPGQGRRRHRRRSRPTRHQEVGGDRRGGVEKYVCRRATKRVAVQYPIATIPAGRRGAAPTRGTGLPAQPRVAKPASTKPGTQAGQGTHCCRAPQLDNYARGRCAGRHTEMATIKVREALRDASGRDAPRRQMCS